MPGRPLAPSLGGSLIWRNAVSAPVADGGGTGQASAATIGEAK